VRSPIDWPGAVALLTGAGSGIGRATAVELGRRGATVLCADLNLEGAEQTVSLCVSAGGSATAYELDVADGDAVGVAAEKMSAEHGALDVLVNNAGVGMAGRFLDTSPEDWDWLLGVNLRGVLNCCYAFGPAMVARRRGHVVNISSGLAYFHRPTESAYVTSKAAVLAFSRTLRADWRRHGIGVSAVCPGVINTPIVRNSRMLGDAAEPEYAARAARLFATRGHPPQDVADAIVRAVERNRSVVPVGREARLGWIAHRLIPTDGYDRFADLSETLTAPKRGR
jgi:2-hydroxycyclohexanecarboxyl-CoA dehydrogenase